jgi:hypothetical protein
MWQVQNPTTGKFFPAPKAMQDQLNAAAGDDVKQRPGTIAPITPITPSVNPNTINPIPKSGAPSAAEQAKLQAKIDAALQAQGQQ